MSFSSLSFICLSLFSNQSCTACKPGQSPNSENTDCDNCGLGRWGDTNFKCHDCVVGTYQDGKGETECKHCKKETYGIKLFNKEKQQRGAVSNTECESCPTNPDQTTGGKTGANNKDACQCPRSRFYQTINDETNETKCLECPDGADCSFKNGIKLKEIIAQPGYWRPTFDSVIFSDCRQGYTSMDRDELALDRCCPLGKCNNSTGLNENGTMFTHPDEQCKDGYKGALCLVCAENYVKQGNTCIECDGGANLTTAFISLIVVAFVAFIGCLLAFLCAPTHKNARKGKRYFGQVKIIIAFLQILAAMPGVFDNVPWPKLVSVEFIFIKKITKQFNYF